VCVCACVYYKPDRTTPKAIIFEMYDITKDFISDSKLNTTFGELPDSSSEPCVFPFKLKDQTFHSCTTQRDPNSQLWCSVQVDKDGRHVVGLGRWGHCDTVFCGNSGNKGGNSDNGDGTNGNSGTNQTSSTTTNRDDNGNACWTVRQLVWH
jgi:hypothetical protein